MVGCSSQAQVNIRGILGPSDPNDMYPIPTQNMRFEAKLICWQRIPLLCDLFGKVSAKSL